ncbi:MAG: hypothetical protein L6Q54_11595 [Leptospiraceae bacterium]|nr:hypothetical protein [Leptospiraceae bacterium]
MNPEITILILRKTETTSREILISVSKKIESESGVKFFKTAYDFEKIIGDVWASNKINLSIKKNITVESNLEAIGIGGSITGKHYDLIIVDDIITSEDRYSKAEREKVKNYVQELLNIIKKPNGRIIFTGTPWHKDDAWGTIKLIAGEAALYDVYNTGIFSDAEIKKQKSQMSSSLFSANYELKHIPSEGRFFPDPIYGEWENGCHNIAYLDTAYDGKNHTALCLAGRIPNNKIQVTGWTWRKSVTQCYSDIIEIVKRYKTGTLYVESNADKGFSAKDLRKLRGGMVEDVYEKQPKLEKIDHYARGNWHRLVFAHDCQKDFLNHILDFEEGVDPDDEADSLASCLRIITGKENLQIQNMALGNLS